ncbi:MAG: M14 family metallopeptidase [Calditrichia bacterium]
MRGLILIIFISFFISGLSWASKDWQTYYEKSDFKKTPRYAETMDYCRRLDYASKWVKLTSFGKSPQGRELPLLIIDKHGNFAPEKVRKSGNVIVLVQAAIHAGESDGKDAGLMLVRDMVISKKLDRLLDKVTFLFIPIFNVDGHERFGPYNRINQNGPEEMGWRVTAQNLNLNRDYLKADAPEMQAWLKMFDNWLPDLMVDCHVTDGADYQYAITYGLEDSQNVAGPLREFSDDFLEPYLDQKMAADNFPMFPYIMFKNWNDIRSGLVSGAASPRYSTGYGAVQNRIFYLIETHMLKDYRTRVTATEHLLIHMLELANQDAGKLKEVNRMADEQTAKSLTGRYLPLVLKTSMKDSTFINFLGVKYDRIPSEISGADWVIYHADQPKTYRMPLFNKVEVSDSVKVPYAYLIPAEWTFAIEKLQLNGVKIRYLANDTTLSVSSYRFSNPQWQEKPFEGHHRVSFQMDTVSERRAYPAGTAVIFLNQRTNRVIVNALEPKGPDSFISWGFWDTIFERKEYSEGYVLEKLARKMLAEDPALMEEFEEKVATDSSFAASSRERLNFFYERSPYWDKQINLYPVGKLMHPVSLRLKN